MRLVQLLCVAALTLLSAGRAFALEACENLFKDSDHLAQHVRWLVTARAPVKYRDLANTIKLVVDVPPTTLMPLATEEQGAKIVVVPMTFVKMACQLAIATSLKISGIQRDDFDRTSQKAAKCVDEGGARSLCLRMFADDLAVRYRDAFAKWAPQTQDIAIVLFYTSLLQFAQHEYAHHYLNHNSRLRANQISRVDAEFEADLFAVMNAVQNGDLAISMFYVLHPLATVEAYTRKLSSADYESARCRASNASNISAVVGIIPVLLANPMQAGSERGNGSAAFRAEIGKFFNRPAPALEGDSCAFIAKVALGELFSELKRLSLRMAADAEILTSSSKKIDAERANRLIGDLVEMAETFKHANGIAAKSIATFIKNWNLNGRSLAPVIGQVDRVLQKKSVAANFQSEDYGVLLASLAYAIGRERTDIAEQSRFDRSSALLREAVHYNPRLAEAWLELGDIAIRRADCAAAARYFETAIGHISATEQPEAKSMATFLAGKFKEWSSDSATCRTEAAKFNAKR